MNQLTIQDLAMAVQVIDVAVERGAFKGPEIFNLGQLREKFAQVVIEAQKVAEAQQQVTSDNFTAA